MASKHDKPLTDAASAEQDALVVTLKRRGLSFADIAAQLGISKSQSHRAFHRALRRIVEPAVTAIRAEQLAQIDVSREVLRDIVAVRHVLVNNGQIIREDGVPLDDDAQVLAAIGLISKLDDQEAKLTGAYPATKTAVEATVNYTVGGGVDPSTLS